MASTGLLLFLLIKPCLSQDVNKLFFNINEETGKFNAMGANIAWESSINSGNPDLPMQSATYQKKRLVWQHRICNKLGTLFNSHLLNDTQRRQAYLLCRGPRFTFGEARQISDLYEELQSLYSDVEVCIPVDFIVNTTNKSDVEDAIINYLSNVERFLNFEHDFILFAAKIAVNGNPKEPNRLCLKGERDFESLMEFSRKEEVLRWMWLTWREKVGPPMRKPFRKLANIENQASRRNGYPNIGASWRDELEMPGLRRQCRDLYNSIKPFYMLLHGVIRFYLRRYYGNVVPRTGLIPAHLLGNLWSQNWEPLSDIMLPRNIDLDKQIKELNWTVEHMVKRAEDFYQSLGLPAMTDTFWRQSIFERANNSNIHCHGTAADMFQDGDYRLLYCAELNKEDFYVLHHELGHIQYYMGYEHQPVLYRQANAALHEAIGDAIMYGVLTPPHLNRLGLINDSLLYTFNNYSINIAINNPAKNNTNTPKFLDKEESNYLNHDNFIMEEEIDNTETDEKIDNYSDEENTIGNKNNDNNIKRNKVQRFHELFNPEELSTDMILLFKQALNKIPQIPFALLIDEYRWKYFEGNIEEDNREFWDLVAELQGVAPPGDRGEEYFDVGAKFHVPDNTPYIRYFLSSFLQHQIFEKLCKAAVYGQRSSDEPVPETIPLTRCDIYGSKTAGKILKDLMSRGHSQHWSEILQETIHEPDISSAALIRYYKPLYNVLNAFAKKYRIPIGW